MWVSMLPTRGFFDMHEMFDNADAYQAAYPTGNPVIDPTHPGNLGSHRVKRGGGWGDGSGNLRSSSRHNPGYKWRRSHIGFRVGFQKSK